MTHHDMRNKSLTSPDSQKLYFENFSKINPVYKKQTYNRAFSYHFHFHISEYGLFRHFYNSYISSLKQLNRSLFNYTTLSYVMLFKRHLF